MAGILESNFWAKIIDGDLPIAIGILTLSEFPQGGGDIDNELFGKFGWFVWSIRFPSALYHSF